MDNSTADIVKHCIEDKKSMVEFLSRTVAAREE
jgi:hypothetical protein